jgi:hypothetical protein
LARVEQVARLASRPHSTYRKTAEQLERGQETQPRDGLAQHVDSPPISSAMPRVIPDDQNGCELGRQNRLASNVS